MRVALSTSPVDGGHRNSSLVHDMFLRYHPRACGSILDHSRGFFFVVVGLSSDAHCNVALDSHPFLGVVVVDGQFPHHAFGFFMVDLAPRYIALGPRSFDYLDRSSNI